MEDFVTWISVFLVGYLLGVLKGRRRRILFTRPSGPFTKPYFQQENDYVEET